MFENIIHQILVTPNFCHLRYLTNSSWQTYSHTAIEKIFYIIIFKNHFKISKCIIIEYNQVVITIKPVTTYR